MARKAASVVVLRNFLKSDIPILQKYRYHDLTDQEMQELLNRWDQKEYEGKCFEMFAIMEGKHVSVPSLSINIHSLL